MNYEIQFAKVTNSGKLADRFLCLKHAKSQDLTKSSMGETFALLEILSPWHNSAQIGQMVINNFPDAYYQGGSTSDLQNFEAALKHINEKLAQITQNGETEWIGNLNGILATMVGESLILASAGKTEAYLFRDGKINHLTYGLANKVEIHPLKTFSNIISGQLKAHDKILIANRNLFENIEIESLRQIITLNNSSPAAAQITKLLRKARVKNVNLFIIELLSKEEIANVPLKDRLENVFYLDKSSEPILAKVKSFWQTILAPLGKIVISTISGTVKSAISHPLVRSVGLRIGKRFQFKRKTGKINPLGETPKDDFQREFMHDSRDDDMLKDEEIKYSPDLYVHYYQEKKARKESKIKSIIKALFQQLKKLILGLAALYRDKKRRKFFYLIIAAIIILVIGLVIGFRGKDKNGLGNLESQKILDEAIAAQKDGKNFLNTGSPEKAKDKFIDAINKAESIKINPLVAKDAEGIITTTNSELDKLTSTTRFNSLTSILSIPEIPKGFFIASGEAFLFTETEIYKASLLGGKPQKVATLPKNEGNITAVVNLSNTLYFYTSNQNLFEFSPTLGKLEQVKIADGTRFETANSIASYAGSVYLLDGVLGQIYKHSSSAQIFEKGEEYVTNSNNLKQSLSLAIDGAIYVLKNDGKVIKFQRSKLQDFSLKNIPTPWDKITTGRKIYTDSDTPSLYILETDQKRILEFDKEGVFIRQYALPENFQKITDFFVSVKSKKIWILNDKDLYEITI